MAKKLNMWQKGGTNSRKNVSKERATQIAIAAGKASGEARRRKKEAKNHTELGHLQ